MDITENKRLIYEQEQYIELLNKRCEELNREKDPKEYWRKYSIVEYIITNLPACLKIHNLEKYFLRLHQDFKKKGNEMTSNSMLMDQKLH